MTEHQKTTKTKILIVEDEALIGLDLKQRLTHWGHTVLGPVFSAEKALERIEQDPPDLVLMDNILKGKMDGIEAADIIRSRWDIPVVFCSAYADQGRLERVKLAYPYGYILKPFQDNEIRITIEMALYVSKVDRERKKAAKTLRETQENLIQTNRFLETITQGITDGIMLLSRDRKILWANEALLRTCGLIMEEVAGKPCYQITHQEENPCQSLLHICPIEGVLQGGRPVSVNHTHFDTEGNRLVVEVTAYPIRDKNNAIVQLVHLSKDVTQHKQMEEKLRETKEYLENLINYANAPIIVWDPMFMITRFNHGFEHLTGYTADEVVGRELDLLFPTGSRSNSLDKIKNTLNGERWESVEIPILRKDGGVRLALWNSANIYAEDGYTQVATIAQGQDITERKQAEQELQASFEKLRKAMGGIIKAMALTIEARDPYTSGHQQRVANLARSIAREMGLSLDQVDGLRMAGLVHDLGKIAIPIEILSKPTELSDLEFGLIKVHPQISYDILKDIDFPWPVAEIVIQHHERMDGSGYPRGLKGDEILIEACILAVADVVEAIASHRPYRTALGIDAALEEIEKNKGLRYDPEVVDACLRLFNEKRYRLEFP